MQQANNPLCQPVTTRFDLRMRCAQLQGWSVFYNEEYGYEAYGTQLPDGSWLEDVPVVNYEPDRDLNQAHQLLLHVVGKHYQLNGHGVYLIGPEPSAGIFEPHDNSTPGICRSICLACLKFSNVPVEQIAW